MDNLPLPTDSTAASRMSHCPAPAPARPSLYRTQALFSPPSRGIKNALICSCKDHYGVVLCLHRCVHTTTMLPLATMSAPSSLLLLPATCQRMGRGRGQSWEEPSISSSQSQRNKLSNTVSAKAVSCVASMNITCCANQTQTARRKSFSGPTSPPSGSVKEKVKSPRLDDGGVGFPPFRFGGGGGGGGGGGSSSSGGFILFVIVLLLDYLREFERNMQNGPRRGSDYDSGLAPQ